MRRGTEKQDIGGKDFRDYTVNAVCSICKNDHRAHQARTLRRCLAPAELNPDAFLIRIWPFLGRDTGAPKRPGLPERAEDLLLEDLRQRGDAGGDWIHSGRASPHVRDSEHDRIRMARPSLPRSCPRCPPEITRLQGHGELGGQTSSHRTVAASNRGYTPLDSQSGVYIGVTMT